MDILIGSVKRYLAKQEYRIELDELVASELKRLLDILDEPEFSTQEEWSIENFRIRVQRYEAATEALARVSAVLGRWGDGSETALIVDLIRSIVYQSRRIANGNSVYLKIRSYPAVLLFVAYGVGLTRSARWATLHAFFTTQLQQEYKESTRIVESLFLGSRSLGDNDLWRNLDGLERRKTALSDHLFDLTISWSTSFVGAEPDIDLLFERFEVLAALAYLEGQGKSTVQQSLAQDSRNGWTWMPIGREGWDEKNQRVLVDELKSGALRDDLIRSGFAYSEAEFMDIFVENFRRICARFHW